MSSTGHLRASVSSLLSAGLLLAAALTPAASFAGTGSPSPANLSARNACVHPSARTHASTRSCRTHARVVRTRSAATQKAVHPREASRSRKIVKHAKHSAPAAATPGGGEGGEGGEPEATQASAESNSAAIAQTLASICQNTELIPEAANLALVRASVLCLINRKRAENGETPLTTNPQLEAAAEGHCQEMIADDYFAHVSPSGETPAQRIRDTGYIPNEEVGYVIGENLAWGTYQLSTPASIVSAWIASPGHLANILEAKYRDTGIAVTPAVPSSLAAGAPGATYAQEFGVIVP